MSIIKMLSGACDGCGSATIAFFGDSVTQGCFASEGDMHSDHDYDAVYHNRLRKMLNLLFPKPVNIINAGVGGEHTADALKRLDTDVISKNPDMVVVCFGLNDVNDELDDFILALSQVFRRLKECGTEIIYMSPNMLNTYVLDSIRIDWMREYAHKTADFQNSGRMDRYIEAACRCAGEMGIPVADCYAKWKELHENGVDTTKLLANGINHPVKEMHELFAIELLDVMLKNG